MNLLLQILAILRALEWSHQTAHWKVRGEPFYGDHLLFQKLYQAVGEEIDTLAEKIVGVYGPDALTNLSVLSDTHQFIANHAATGAGDSSYQCALQMEEHLQRALKLAYDELKASGEMSLGLDDFLMATANAHETALYLLRQRLRSRMAGKVASALRPGEALLKNGQYDLLTPGDRITVDGRKKVVLNFEPVTNTLVYVDEGKSTKRSLDVGLAVAWEPGETPETLIKWVGPGEPPARKMSPRRRFTPPAYD